MDLPPLNTVYHLLFPDVILYHLRISCNRILYYYTTRCQRSPHCIALYLLSPLILFSFYTSCRLPVVLACLVRSYTPANEFIDAPPLWTERMSALGKKIWSADWQARRPHFPINTGLYDVLRLFPENNYSKRCSGREKLR